MIFKRIQNDAINILNKFFDFRSWLYIKNPIKNLPIWCYADSIFPRLGLYFSNASFYTRAYQAVHPIFYMVEHCIKAGDFWDGQRIEILGIDITSSRGAIYSRRYLCPWMWCTRKGASFQLQYFWSASIDVCFIPLLTRIERIIVCPFYSSYILIWSSHRIHLT